MFIYLFWEGGAERKREIERESQTGFELSSWSLMWGSIMT